MGKTLRFVKVKCECGHVNLVPVYEVFQVFEPIKCEQCGKTIAEYEGNLIDQFLKEAFTR